LGPLQAVGRARDQAVVLRRALQQERDWDATNTATSCGPPRARHARVRQTPERRLAKRLQPELIVDRTDGFWPVSVQTLFSMQDRRARLCRRVADGVCVRISGQADLPFNGGEGEWLDNPANGHHTDDQQRAFLDALGSSDPSRTARVYFLVTRGPGRAAPVSVQYWFFYTFNYLRVGTWLFGHAGGLHEGDFETVGMLLSARTHQPRYVWMARHKDEGRSFLWSEEAIKKAGEHLVAYAARGSHASYENCRRQRRIQAPRGLIDDRPQCDPDEALHLAPEATRLIDLSRVAWACWRGRFGAHPGAEVADRLPHESDDGPRGPLWQQRFGGVTYEPCRGVRYSKDRDGPSEEVLDDRTSSRLRARAGRLDPLVDSCGDWEHPATSGAFVVACDARRLRRYIDSGLENPGRGGLRIDVGDRRRPRTGPVDIPAVRRDPRIARFDTWLITATEPTVAQVYASCQAGDGILEARFPQVAFEANRTLRIDDRARTTWRLRDQDGTVLYEAQVHVVKRPEGERGLRCGTPS
jgi:hypothetical protein